MTPRLVHFQSNDGSPSRFSLVFFLEEELLAFAEDARSVAARREPRLFLFERLSPRFDIQTPSSSRRDPAQFLTQYARASCNEG